MKKSKTSGIDLDKFRIRGPVPDYMLVLRAPDGHKVGTVTYKNGKAAFKGDIEQAAGTIMQILTPLVMDK